MITNIYVKETGRTRSKSSGVDSLYLESYLRGEEAERLKREISNVPGIKKVDILYGSLDPIDFPIGFSVVGTNPSDVFQRITSLGYAITKSSIKVD